MIEEIILDQTDFLVSETDSTGKIIFANKDFEKISGYSIDELVGQQHNIVRSSDMPKWAFEDLWKVIKTGKIWSGYVKNSAKDGRFYWVFATIYPYSNINGGYNYMSCRRKVLPKEIERIKIVYNMS